MGARLEGSSCMTSVTEQRRERQLALMLALGELVTVTDPVSGEVHYLATTALQDTLEGRESEPARSEHGRHGKTPVGYGRRSRTATALVALGLIGFTALPLASQCRKGIPAHMVEDVSTTAAEVPEGASASGEAEALSMARTTPASSRIQQLQQTKEGMPTPTPSDTLGTVVKPRPVTEAPTLRDRLTRLVQGTGKHRAPTRWKNVESQPPVSVPVPVTGNAPSPVPALAGGVLVRANVSVFEYFPERRVGAHT